MVQLLQPNLNYNKYTSIFCLAPSSCNLATLRPDAFIEVQNNRNLVFSCLLSIMDCPFTPLQTEKKKHLAVATLSLAQK